MSDYPPAPNYAEGTWAGYLNYQCLLCGFATTHFPKLREHLQMSHATTPALGEPPQAPTPLPADEPAAPPLAVSAEEDAEMQEDY